MRWALKFKLILFSAIAAFAVVLFQNCGKPTDLQSSKTLDLSSQTGLQDASLNILRKNCSECHNNLVTSGNVADITDLQYLAYSRLVIPGEPEISPIISQISQGLMPQGRTGLVGSDVDTLKKWISGLKPDAGGGGAPPPSTPIEAKYSSLAQQIFTPQCINCHAGRNYKLNSYVEVLRTVTKGDAANSLLYQAITVGRTGGKMPQGGGLSGAQVKAVQDWINAGAPNN